jgi:phenylalanyl-tRNA synthetase beta chain
VATLLFYLGKEYSIQASEDGRFIAGRQARLSYRGREVGLFGELHPKVLEAWGITVPCAAGEVDLESILED